jgi:DNA-binding response OmpR family regulator
VENKTVLLVDDDVDIGRLIQLLLRQEFCVDVSHAITGEEGLALLDALQPVLVMVDLKLPGMTGFEFIQQLKANAVHKRIPVICITALDKAQERALLEGCAEFIAKPFDINVLLAKVQPYLMKNGCNSSSK